MSCNNVWVTSGLCFAAHRRAKSGNSLSGTNIAPTQVDSFCGWNYADIGFQEAMVCLLFMRLIVCRAP